MATTEREVKGRAGRAGLTRERIVETAIEVIDDGWSWRASRCGGSVPPWMCDAMAVYGHFENKAALLDAVVEHEAERLGDLRGPLRMNPSRRCSTSPATSAPCCSSTRTLRRSSPAVRSPSSGPRRSSSSGCSCSSRPASADEDIPVATDALVTFILGFILQESGRSRWRAELGDEFDQQQVEIRDRLAEMPMDTAIAQALVSRRLDDAATTVEFETGMRAMLHGLRLGLGRVPTSESWRDAGSADRPP